MLERTWGEVPGDFLELYRAHDGQVGEDVDFVPLYCLMPIAEVIKLRRLFEELEEELDEDEEQVWDDAWIVFAQLPVYNQYLCLHAKTGEVVAYDHRGCDWAVIARSFGDFLTHIRIAVKQGQFVVTKGGIAEHAKHKHWLTAWVRACEPSKPPKHKSKPPKRKPRKRKTEPKPRRPRSR
jgi:hypothetical protein